MIEIDLSELALDQIISALSEEMVVQVLDDVAASCRAKWIRLAQTELGSSRQTYIQGIQEVEATGPMERTIALLGWLPNAIENGLAPFDMRQTLLGAGSSIRREGKNGFYARVPFRHGTPGSSGLAGLPMGEAYGQRGAASRAVGGGHGPAAAMSNEGAAAFGKAIYSAAKQLRAKRAGKSAGRLHAPAPLLKGHHQTSIYHGMSKVRKPYANPRTQRTTVQSQYVTFRTISNASGVGWIHPGIEPRRLSEKVADHATEVMSQSLAIAYAAAVKDIG